MAIATVIGTIGALFLAVSWLPETYHALKDKESKLDPKFVELMFAGVLLLTIYSWAVMDMVFLGLNIFILANVSVSLYYEIKQRLKKK